MNIKVCCSPLVDILHKMESTKYTIQHAYNDLNNLNLEANPAFVDPYMNSKLDGHETNSVIRLSMSAISPTTYGYCTIVRLLLKVLKEVLDAW